MKIHCLNDKSGCKTRCIKMALMLILGLAALAWVVMLLWNWLMPSVFSDAQQIDYFHALGILLLSKILFGNYQCHSRCHDRHQYSEKLTPQEREQMRGQFKSRWSKCCGSDKAEDETANSKVSHVE